jgi:putative transposase
VKANQVSYSTAAMCRTLDVSESGYYAWCKRPPSKRSVEDQALTQSIQAIHLASDGSYGAPRIREELADAQHVCVGTKRVARLMRLARLQGVTRRKFCVTTVRDERARPAPDLVERQFKAARPNQLWVADITYVPTWSGFLFLAVVIDVWSRKVVGWSMAGHMRSELVVAALDMAIEQRKPRNVVHHSDQGSQYTSLAFGARCKQAGVRISMGSVGDAYDNAMCESFFATLECELIDRRNFRNQTEARQAVFTFIEGWYNRRRRHSSLNYLSPLTYEQKHLAAA